MLSHSPLDPSVDQLDQRIAQRMTPPGDLHPPWPAERLLLLHLKDRAGDDPELAQVTQGSAVSVGHPIHPEPGSCGCCGERVAPVLVVPTAAGRDRIPVRVPRRMTEHGVDPLLQPFAQDMLEQLGLGVDLIPGNVQHPQEECLQQPVPPDDPQSDPLALRSPAPSGRSSKCSPTRRLAIADAEGDDTPNS